MILKNGKRIDGCSDTLPIGTVQPFLGLTPPKGYLLCQGQAVNKITYSELYEICGDTFGQSTETEFYLPDLRGKTIAGYNESDISMNTIGKLLGQKTHVHTTGNHTLTVDEMPAHKHNFRSIPGSSGGDLGDYTLEYLLEEGDAYPGHPGVATSGDWGSYGTLWITETGGSQAHNHGDTGEASNYQPTIVMNWIVKAVMTVPIQSSLVTAYTDSSTDVYTCDYVNEAIRTGLGDNVPAGTIVDYDGEEIPDGWELADEYASVYIGPDEPVDSQDVWITSSDNLVNINNYVASESQGFPMVGIFEVGKTYVVSFTETNTLYGFLTKIRAWEATTPDMLDYYSTTSFTFTYTQAMHDNGFMLYVVSGSTYAILSYEEMQALNLQIRQEKDIYIKNELGNYEKVYNREKREIYNLKEEVIGTWLGEPLYRKVIKVIPAAQHYTDYPHGIEGGPKDMVNFYGYYRRTSSQYMNPLPCTYPAWEAYLYDLKGATYSMRFSDNVWNSGIDYCYVVIEYTKNN